MGQEIHIRPRGTTGEDQAPARQSRALPIPEGSELQVPAPGSQPTHVARSLECGAGFAIHQPYAPRIEPGRARPIGKTEGAPPVFALTPFTWSGTIPREISSAFYGNEQGI